MDVPISQCTIAGCALEILDAGAGAPLLFLHGVEGIGIDAPHAAPLSAARRLIAPSHPGFGHSDLPEWLDHPADIACIYLELLDRMGLRQVDLLGCSIGAWIACEMAAMTPDRFGRFALAGPIGLKFGPVDRLDIPDIFAMPQNALDQLLFHDPERFRMDPAQLPDDALAVQLRNRETQALLAWEPYMHNPKLAHRLHRAAMPTLLIRGAADGLVSEAYLEGFARLLPQAQRVVIPEAGHFPHLEQPEAFAAAVSAFLGR
jgi:pimeloyl-ACP methyl ester carboxylesterase